MPIGKSAIRQVRKPALLAKTRSRFRRRSWTAPHTAAKSRYVNDGAVGGIELDSLDVRKRQVIEGPPGLSIVAREPKTRAGRALGQRHVNPTLVPGMKIAAES